VPELWLIHPTNRTLTIYRLEDGRYGPPTTLELSGTICLAVPGGHQRRRYVERANSVPVIPTPGTAVSVGIFP